METFIITSFSRDISLLNIAGLIIGHLIFAIALTQILDWTWLKNLISEEEKNKNA